VRTLLTFAVYGLVSNILLTSDRAFASLAVINIMGRPMQVIPTSVNMLVDALVSLNRIESAIHEAIKFKPSLFKPKNTRLNNDASFTPTELDWPPPYFENSTK